MIFKTKEAEAEYQRICPMLKLLCIAFEQKSLSFNKEPVITRILGVEVRDSNVHACGRAVDFRCEYDGKFMYTDDEAVELVKHINKLFPRSDEPHHFTMKYHSHEGNPFHFHGQLPWDIRLLKGMVFNIYPEDPLTPAA